MGEAMALNLQGHLSRVGAPSLCFYNRTESRGSSVLDIGGVRMASVSELITHTDICFISVSNDEALTAIITSMLGNDAADGLRQKIIVDTSTVHPHKSSWAQQKLMEKGASFIAAPVFGASPVARKGQLLFVIAGAEEAVQAIQPFLVGVIARGILRLGEDVTQASLLKTAGYLSWRFSF